MKVARVGPDPKAWRHEVDCGECKATLEIELTDVRRHDGVSDGPHHGSDRFTVSCIVCRTLVHVAEAAIPAEFRRLIARAR
jgi:hypothetical protein